MSYLPTNWKNGNVITAEKLNNLENGVSAGGMLVVSVLNGVLDKTWQEIYDAMLAGGAIVSVNVAGDVNYSKLIQVVSCGKNENGYYVIIDSGKYQCSAPNEYPSGGGK